MERITFQKLLDSMDLDNIIQISADLNIWYCQDNPLERIFNYGNHNISKAN